MNRPLILLAAVLGFTAVLFFTLWLGCRSVSRPKHRAAWWRPNRRSLSRRHLNRLWKQHMPLWRAQMKPITDKVIAAWEDNLKAMPELGPERRAEQ